MKEFLKYLDSKPYSIDFMNIIDSNKIGKLNTDTKIDPHHHKI